MFRRTLARFNLWYDRQKEPKRFLIAMSIGILPYILLDMLSILSAQIVFDLLGMLWIILVIAMRVWWIYGSLKTHIDPR